MADKRVVDESPTFSLIQSEDEKKRIIQEIHKLKPKVEISLEGSGELASARIVDWEPLRKLFTIQWTKKSDAFEEKLESDSGLRAFFKVNLFSKMLVFKSVTVRRMPDGTYHYRIPEQFYQQQRRSALRVPIDPSLNAFLSTSIGEFEIIDMSVGGAKLKMPSSLGKTLTLGASYAPVNLSVSNASVLGGFDFSIKVTHLDPTSAGCRFLELKKDNEALIKQFLIDALHLYFEKTFRSKPAPENETGKAPAAGGMTHNPGGKTTNPGAPLASKKDESKK